MDQLKKACLFGQPTLMYNSCWDLVLFYMGRILFQLIDEAVPYSCKISDIIVWNRFVDKLFWKEIERKNGKAQSLSVPRIWCWGTIQYCKLFHFLVCGYTILKILFSLSLLWCFCFFLHFSLVFHFIVRVSTRTMTDKSANTFIQSKDDNMSLLTWY